MEDMSENVGFWGLQILPGQDEEIVPEYNRALRITQIAMDPRKAKANAKAIVLVDSDASDHVICTLTAAAIPQFNTDLFIAPNQALTFKVEGDTPVHLSGYMTSVGDDDDEGSYFDDEGIQHEMEMGLPSIMSQMGSDDDSDIEGESDEDEEAPMLVPSAALVELLNSDDEEEVKTPATKAGSKKADKQQQTKKQEKKHEKQEKKQEKQEQPVGKGKKNKRDEKEEEKPAATKKSKTATATPANTPKKPANTPAKQQQSPAKSIKCDQCPKAFSNEVGLAQHKKIKHE